MRTGFILSINRVAGIGLMRDSNDQTIRFYLDENKETFQRGDYVSFEISFRNRNLVAVNIIKCALEKA